VNDAALVDAGAALSILATRVDSWRLRSALDPWSARLHDLLHPYSPFATLLTSAMKHGCHRPHMSEVIERTAAPLELGLLLGARQPADRDAAWERLIARHSRLLLSVARSYGGDRDQAMERYTFILDKCRESDFRRLRAFDPNGGASFATWLTIAARRLCTDHYRALYGRRRSKGDENHDVLDRRAARRALVSAVGEELNLELIVDASAESPDAAAVRAECSSLLHEAIAELSPRERLLLALRFEDDLPASRIASALGLATPFHVYRQLNAILARLRSVLVQRGVDGDDA
jgi:RNA polymerase sigma factor (sigma-70 family)